MVCCFWICSFRMKPSMTWHRFLFFSMNCYAALGNIREWFPVAFSMVWNSVFLLKLVVTLEGLVCTAARPHSWKRKEQMDLPSFHKGISAKVSATDYPRISLPIPLFIPISTTLPIKWASICNSVLELCVDTVKVEYEIGKSFVFISFLCNWEMCRYTPFSRIRTILNSTPWRKQWGNHSTILPKSHINAKFTDIKKRLLRAMIATILKGYGHKREISKIQITDETF